MSTERGDLTAQYREERVVFNTELTHEQYQANKEYITTLLKQPSSHTTQAGDVIKVTWALAIEYRRVITALDALRQMVENGVEFDMTETYHNYCLIKDVFDKMKALADAASN